MASVGVHRKDGGREAETWLLGESQETMGRILRNATCPNEGPGSRAGRKGVELRTLWKVKSAGSCDHLDARAKEREAPKITSRRLSGVVMPLSGSGN